MILQDPYSVLHSLVQNKYINWYTLICQNAYSRSPKRKDACRLFGVVESHHIVPKSFKLGFFKNVVHLTPREHFICHKLLVFAFKTSKFYLPKCLKAMAAFQLNGRGQRRVFRSRDYNYIRESLSKSRQGEGNPMYGRCGNLSPRFNIKHDEETKIIIRQKRAKQKITQKQLDNLANGRKDWSGLHMPESAKVNMRKAQRDRIWVNNPITNEHRRIKFENLSIYLENGFVRGRK